MWYLLSSDVLHRISQLLPTAGDLARFRAVCSHWRSSASLPSPHHHLPLLALPSLRRFPSLSLPNLALPPPPGPPPHCCGSSSSFLALLDRSLRLLLFHPLSSSLLPLPPPVFPHHLHLCCSSTGYSRIHPDSTSSPITFNYACHYLLSKLILSSDPRDGGCVAAAIHSFSRGLAFCRPRDPSWTVLQSSADTAYADVISYDGQFYAVDYRMQLFVCSGVPEHPKVNTLPVALPDTGRCRGVVDRLYLVELEGELAMVVRWIDVQYGEEGGDGEVGFVVHRMVVEDGRGRWVEAKGLGGRALFLGLNRSVALIARDLEGCKRNCIYYSHDCSDDGYGEMDYVVYDMEVGPVERVVVRGCAGDDDRRSSTWQSPVWLTPTRF